MVIAHLPDVQCPLKCSCHVSAIAEAHQDRRGRHGEGGHCRSQASRPDLQAHHLVGKRRVLLLQGLLGHEMFDAFLAGAFSAASEKWNAPEQNNPTGGFLFGIPRFIPSFPTEHQISKFWAEVLDSNQNLAVSACLFEVLSG